MLLVVGRNYQRNVFLRRIKNRRAGNLYSSQFRQADQQTPSEHTMPQHGTSNQYTTFLSELGSSKKASETVDLSSLRPRSRTSQQSTRQADRLGNEEDETGTRKLTYECMHPILRMCSKKTAAAPSTRIDTCAQHGEMA
jgi:hypothetical protein